MCPLAFASHFWYKFYASLQAAQCFCTVPCNTVEFNADSTRPVRGQGGQTSAQLSSYITVIMSN
jgi:hypothetical protein